MLFYNKINSKLIIMNVTLKKISLIISSSFISVEEKVGQICQRIHY